MWKTRYFRRKQDATSKSNIIKLVLVAGGCKGLGKELSLQLVSRGMWIPADHPRPVVFPFCPDVYLCSGIAGAHVTIIARSQKELRETELAMEAKKVRPE